MKRYKYKKRNRIMLLLILVIGIAIGYSLLGSTLKINGYSGINKNTWDIHWDDESIHETEGSVTAKTSAHVTDNEKKNVSFDVELELPGDYYEFTINAVNTGSVDGAVSDVLVKYFEENGTTQLDSLPPYYKCSFTHIDGSEVEKNEVIGVNKSIGYKLRIEFDSNVKELPDDPQPVKEDIALDVSQTKTTIVTFNPNGGSVNPTTKSIVAGGKIGTLPIPTKENMKFKGWYTSTTDGVKIDEDVIPNGNVTYVALWREIAPVFDTGESVNAKFKALAGNDEDVTDDEKIVAIVKSTTEPDESIKNDEHKVSAPGSDPIYAWFDTDTIYYWSNSETVDLNQDAKNMFNGFTNLTTLDITVFNTDNTTDMSGMFSNIGNASLDFSNFDTTNVTDMSGMFSGSKITSLNLSKFDTKKVTTMSTMFAGCSGLTSLNISSFNTSNVTNMSAMFVSCTGLTSLDLSNFDTTNVTNMVSMFGACANIRELNLSNWNFRNALTSGGSFIIGYLSGGSLNGLKKLKLDNTKYPSHMGGAFNGLTNLEELSLKNVDTSNVTNMNRMFSGLMALKALDVSSFDTSNVTDMNQMFTLCRNVEKLDLSNFNTSNVTDFGSMFAECTKLSYLNLSNWNFTGSTFSSLSLDLGLGYVTSLDEYILDNAILPVNCESAFAGFSSRLKKLSIKNIDTSNVINMRHMFSNTPNIKTLDLSSFNTSKVVNMEYMFEDTGLVVLDLRTFDVSQVTTALSMFSNSEDLKTIIVNDNFTVEHFNNSESMFYRCLSIEGEQGTTYDSSHASIYDGNYAHIDGGSDNPGYLTRASNVKYTITLNANNGTVNPTSYEIYKNNALGYIPTPIRSGYTFDGWFTGLTDGVKVDNSYIPTGNTTLYARWIEE